MKETGHSQAQRKIAQFISENVSGEPVLDVATGTGLMLEPFCNGVGVGHIKRNGEGSERKVS